MTASTAIVEFTGVPNAAGWGTTKTVLTSARYCTNDDPAPGLTNPIPIPAAGINYSFWKQHALIFEGTYTQIDNIRWYCDGDIGWNYGASGALLVGYRFSGDIGSPASTNYVQASGTVGTTGLWLASGHTYYNMSGCRISGATNFVVGSPATIDSTAYGPNASGFSKLLVTQVAVATDATQGTQTAETATFRYDEI